MAPVAYADPISDWTDHTAPGTDPWSSYFDEAGTQYTAQEKAEILKDRIARTPKGLVAELGLSDSEAAYAASRVGRLQQLLGLRGASTILATRVGMLSTAGIVALTGYEIYKITRTWTDSAGGSHSVDEYEYFNRAIMGGAAVVIPSQGQGSSWRPMNNANYIFGWKHVADIDYNMSGLQAGWVFQYEVEVKNTSSNTWVQHTGPVMLNPGGGSPGNYHLAPDAPNYCVLGHWYDSCNNAASATTGASSQCLKYDGTSGSCFVVMTDIQSAEWQTISELDGERNPILIHSDMAANATGHRWGAAASNNCVRTVTPSVACAAAYIPDGEWEKTVPQFSDTNPNPGQGLAGTASMSPDAGAGDSTHRAAADADETPCERALFNALIDSAHYTYTGCVGQGTDAANGDGLPETTPATGGGTSTVTIPQTVTTETFTPFILPRPDPYETYDDYIQRLREHGWMGTATKVNDSTLDGTAVAGSDYEKAKLESPTAAKVGSGTYVQLYTSTGTKQDWSATDLVQKGSSITVKVKPPGSSLPPPANGGGIDFSPITDLDPGCKFPYGFVCYAQQVNGWFDVTPVAPEFDLPVHGQTVGGSTITLANHYDVNLNVMDDYMVIWRSILSVVIWVGAVYILATRLLGFKAGGDPGEAIDEVL